LEVEIKFAILTLLFCLCGYGQEAYVVQLSPVDATQARQTWDALQTAQKNWEATQNGIALKYLIVDPKDPDASEQPYTPIGALLTTGSAMGCIIISSEGSLDCSNQKTELDKEGVERKKEYAREKRQRRGFQSDIENKLPSFEFSHDFRYIVPAKAAAKSATSPLLFWDNATPVPLTNTMARQ
jgi:hypothetical protein